MSEEMDNRMNHPINRSINNTVLEIVKALQISLKNSELSSDDKIKAATIAMSEAIKHYRLFLNQVGLEISYTMLLQHFQNIQQELAMGEPTTPYQQLKESNDDEPSS
jgi:hypothetical protein